MITDTPTMPVVQAEVRIVGIVPDPTPTTVFNWNATLEFDAASCPNGPNRKIAHSPISGTAKGGKFTVQFAQIRGGTLTLTVNAQVGGQTLQVAVTGIKIAGTNPSRQAVAQKFPDRTLRQIVSQESGMRQFGPSSDCPLWSGDKLGGVGMMQITNPKPTDDEVWDWTANMARGQKILQEKVAVAKGYPAKVRQSAGFQASVAKFNQTRQNVGKNPLAVTLPDFDADQLRLDSIRGYNGFAGTDAFGNVLHEFRVPVDVSGNLVAAEQPDGKTALIAWQQVPVSDRPKTFGDPNYVAHVTSQQV